MFMQGSALKILSRRLAYHKEQPATAGFFTLSFVLRSGPLGGGIATRMVSGWGPNIKVKQPGDSLVGHHTDGVNR